MNIYYVQFVSYLTSGATKIIDIEAYTSLREAVSCAYRSFVNGKKNMLFKEHYRIVTLTRYGMRLLRTYRYTDKGKRRIEKLNHYIPAWM